MVSLLNDFTMDPTPENALNGLNGTRTESSDSTSNLSDSNSLSNLSTYNTSSNQETSSSKGSDSVKEAENDAEEVVEGSRQQGGAILAQKLGEKTENLEEVYDPQFPLLASFFTGNALFEHSPFNLIASISYSDDPNLDPLLSNVLEYYKKNQRDLLIFDDLEKFVFPQRLGLGICAVDLTGEIWY